MMRLSKAAGIISNIILAVVIILCIPVGVPRVFGYQSYHIISGSMEPAISVGSLVYVKEAQPASVAVGDVIAYSSGVDGSEVITHRVTENNPDGQNFITKGDANAEPDLSPVRYSRLLGVVTFTIPKLGVLCGIISTTSGRMTLIALLALAVVLRMLAALLHAMAKDKDEPKEKSGRVKKDRSPGRSKTPGLAAMFLLVGAVLVLGAGGWLFVMQRNYSKSNDLYETLDREYVSHNTAANVNGGLTTAQGQTEAAPDWDVCAEVDFAGLKAENADVVGWLCFENEDISYPILYSGDDDTYLRTALDGTRATAGCIFVEGKNTPDFSDSHTIVYGHNMRNLSMFGKLRYYYQQDEYYGNHQYFQILTEEAAYRYRIFAYEHVPQDSAIYAVPFAPDEEFAAFLDSLYGLSLRNTGVTVTKDDLVVTLSTCSTTGNRFVVHALRVGEQ
ncbi:MAG: signal peptidase I [Blautia sp.]|nr:signal peptidase I [Blautia sp.]